MNYIICLIFISLAGQFVHAEEQALDLDSVSTPAAPAPSHESNFRLMGRVDLTAEFGHDAAQNREENELKNNHFLIFLRVQASPKTSFMGEILSQSFFIVDYKMDLATVQFGKILVPFADTRRFHYFYGGVQGFGVNGAMLPNIWAEPGINLVWKIKDLTIDTYMVNSIGTNSTTTAPQLTDSVSDHQAFGARATYSPVDKITFVLSGYRGEYNSGKAVYLSGADVYTDYGFLGTKHIKASAGIANASFIQAPAPNGTFEKRGDYAELSTDILGYGELRGRYGTYVDNHRTETSNDIHSFAFGYKFSVDVIQILVEHQWNFEAVNETDNDLTRIMVALDF